MHRVVYTDGACTNNGISNAVQFAGIGIAMGTMPQHQWSIRVNDDVDPDAPRTNQRAELLAAIDGINLCIQWWLHGAAKHTDDDPEQMTDMVLATDSIYVVKVRVRSIFC